VSEKDLLGLVAEALLSREVHAVYALADRFEEAGLAEQAAQVRREVPVRVGDAHPAWSLWRDASGSPQFWELTFTAGGYAGRLYLNLSAQAVMAPPPEGALVGYRQPRLVAWREAGAGDYARISGTSTPASWPTSWGSMARRCWSGCRP